MKLTKETLKRIIKEELEATLREASSKDEKSQAFIKQAAELAIASGLSKEEASKVFKAFLDNILADKPENVVDNSPLDPLK